MNRRSSIKIMGVLNVTPDSFSDGGQFNSLDRAVEQAQKLIAEGADILDIGGESTRPFAARVSVDEELQRVIPVIEAIRSQSPIPISIDTSKAQVARLALETGADIINDVTALQKDPEMIEVARNSNCEVILMHMQGTPADMQVNPSYNNVTEEICSFFKKRIAFITEEGLDKKRIIVDPGIGFGKNLAHNLSILKNLNELSKLGVPLLLAHSRKRFLGEVAGIDVEAERDLATAVVAALSARKNIAMVRVHDVAATRQALEIVAAIDSAA